MESEMVEVPWSDDVPTEKRVIEKGQEHRLPGPGWGADVNEDGVKEYPPIEAKSGLV